MRPYDPHDQTDEEWARHPHTLISFGILFAASLLLAILAYLIG